MLSWPHGTAYHQVAEGLIPAGWPRPGRRALSFVHKGVVFRLVPDAKPSKLSKLVKQRIVAINAAETDGDLLPEMQHEWEQDWAEL